MRRIILLALLGLLCIAQGPSGSFPPGVFGNRAALDAAPVASTTTLDPANTGGGGALSGGNLVLTWASSNASSRSLASHATGKYYFEATFGGAMNAGFSMVGVANASKSMSSGDLGGPDSGGVGFGDTPIYSNGARAFGTAPAAGAVVGFAVDVGNKLAWYQVLCGSWSGGGGAGTGDPAAGTGGADISNVTGALYASVHVESNSNSVMTANFGATSYNCTPPTGFGNW